MPEPFLLRGFLPLLLCTAPLALADSPAGHCRSTLCSLVASGSLSTLRWPDFSDYRDWVQDFYRPSGYAFAWSVRGSPTGAAKSIMAVLTDADAKGLDARDYSDSRRAGRLDRFSSTTNSPSEADLARFDLALTVSLMRYISDLNVGKMNPGLFRGDFDLAPGQHDLAAFVRERLVGAENVESVLDGVEPPYDGYRRTRQALQHYLALTRAMTRQEENAAPLPLPKKTVEPGSSYSALPQLAAVLRRLGDFSGDDATVPPNSHKYEGPMVDAVKHFQERHGLVPDGNLGKATLAQINMPLSHRVRQLQLTLERWRWVPHSFPRPPIVVNIPEFRLRALDASYHTELEMKVVVGQAFFGHQTPVFAADMTYVTFRPYWNVPLSIQKVELVPKIDKDRSYLAKNGYEVVTVQDTVIGAGMVDDELLDQLRSGDLHLRQVPGPENALGLIAFMFPNKHDVYLHGTPATELFSKTRRDFSHGCIRAEKPEQVAAWVLRDMPEWTPERIAFAMNNEAMDTTKPLKVTLARPVPVLIVYATAVVLESGEVRFLDDIYKQDAGLDRLLAKGYPYTGRKPTSAAHGPRPRE